MTTSKTISWECGRCREKGNMAHLDDISLNTIRYAIQRGHDRRAPGCHLLHGLKHVWAIVDGKRHRFSEPTPRDDGPETVAGREVSRR